MMKKGLLIFTVFVFSAWIVSAGTPPDVKQHVKQLRKNNLSPKDSEAVFLLDSLHTDYPDGGKERTYHYYDESGHPLLMVAHWWTSDGAIDGGVKEEREYDAQGNEILYVYYSWSNNDWLGDRKAVKGYDESNHLISETNYYYNKGWSENSRLSYEYDSNNRKISQIREIWRNEWVYSTKDEYSYREDSDQELSYLSYNWNSTTGDWEKSYKLSNDYDENGYLNRELSSIWLSDQEAWFDGYKIEYDNDEHGNPLLKVEYFMNEETSAWEEGQKVKYAYQYDGQYNILESVSQWWQADLQDWLPQEKYEYAYDKFGNMSLFSLYVWESAEWTGSFNFEYFYNDDNVWVDFISYSWDYELKEWVKSTRNKLTPDENNCIYEELGQYWDGEAWITNITNHYYWHEFIASAIQHPALSKVSVYTQNNTIVINEANGQSIAVYDLQGHLYRSVRLASASESIPVASGIYLVKAGKQVVKVIVQ